MRKYLYPCTLANGAPAGRSWTGKVHVVDCEVGRYDSITLLITGTRRNDYFTSRVWLDAVIVTTETHNGVQVRVRCFLKITLYRMIELPTTSESLVVKF